VIIATTGLRNIGPCIKSLQSQTYKNYEIIIISKRQIKKPETIPIEAGRSIKINVLTELNMSQARNKGVSLSRGEIIAFIDDDVILPTHWAENIVKEFSYNCDVVGGRKGSA